MKMKAKKYQGYVKPRDDCLDCKGTGIIQGGTYKGLSCIKCMKFGEPEDVEVDVIVEE